MGTFWDGLSMVVVVVKGVLGAVVRAGSRKFRGIGSKRVGGGASSK